VTAAAGVDVPVRSLRLLQMVAFTSALDRFCVAPMLAVIAVDLGVGLAGAVTVATVYFLAYGVMQPVWGLLCDRVGRVRTLRLALLLTTAVGIVSVLAPSLEVLVVSRGVAGACFSAAIPTVLVYVGDSVGLARRQAAITDVMTGIAGGTALAAASGGFVAEHLGWRWAFGATTLAAAALWVALRGLPEPEVLAPQRVSVGLRLVLTRPWPLLVLLLAFTEGFVLLGIFTFLPAALENSGSSTSVAGLVTGAYGLSVLVCAQWVKRLSSRRDPALLIALGGMAAVAGLSAVSSRQVVPTVLVACVLLGAAWAFMHSTLQTWVTQVAPHARATAVSFFSASLFAGSAAGAAVGGRLVGAGSYSALFLLGAAVCAPLTLVAAASRMRFA
jgi:MFS transporter, YNFM family, putative membrane transport protein